MGRAARPDGAVPGRRFVGRSRDRRRAGGALSGAAFALLAGCAASPPPCPTPLPTHYAALVDRGWHVEIGLPADDLQGGLSVFREIFPGARAFMFGYGKRTFFTAPTDSISEYMLGPVPGPAAIQVTGLSAPPRDAYPPGSVMLIALPPGGAEGLSRFLWNDFARDPGGGPRLIGPGPFPGSLFYAAASGYSLGHTCNNTWVAEALRAASLPISANGVMLSGQTVSRAAAAGACAANAAAPRR